MKEQFIARLEDKFGKWDRATSRFGSSSFGEVSKALSISPSQFTKLISGTATEGMYSRSLENIDRLIKRDSMGHQLVDALNENKELKVEFQKVKKNRNRHLIIIALSSIIIGFLVAQFFGQLSSLLNVSEPTVEKHPLSKFFDNSSIDEYNSPYLSVDEIQDYCPCSAYEGVWSLDKQYKLPLPGSKKPGLYYTAVSADVRMKCSRNDTLNVGKGNVLLGYEYLVNEIWLDTKQSQISPLYFDKINKKFTREFETLDFNANPQFKKIATINSFFIDKFEIHDSHIVRNGEPCGRYATNVNEALAKKFDIDIEYILENILSNLTTTACEVADNPYCDPNDLKSGESVISFDCLYTIDIENLGIGGGYPYQKSYRLDQQVYEDNLTCMCDTSL